MSKFIDLTGQRFGRLIVVNKLNDRTPIHWECVCDCGKHTIVSGTNLKSGHTQSCGCLNREKTLVACKKYNQYDLSGEYGVGFASNNNKTFYFDKDDYNLIKNYCWYHDNLNYIRTRINKNTQITLHRLIMNPPDDKVIDHINYDTTDNRKSNLRICTQSQNLMNSMKRIDNTSGHTGVYYNKRNKKWFSVITVNGEVINLGTYKDKNDAIKIRQQAERQYFGKYQNTKK